MLLNDLMKQVNESVDQTGPKFTGYWKGKDAGTPGKKMVGEADKPPKQGMGSKTWMEPDLLNALALKRIHDKEAEKLKATNTPPKANSTNERINVYAISIPLENVEHYIETDDKDFALSKAINWQMNKMPNKFKEIVFKDKNWQDVVLKIWDQAKIIYKGKQMPQANPEYRTVVYHAKNAGGDSTLSQKLVRELNLIIADYRKKYGLDSHGLRLPGYAPMENVNKEGNPTDKVTMDVPLFIRMMEYAREDAKTDMDLHNVTERAIELMKQNEHLTMDQYDELVGGEQNIEEDKIKGVDNKACWKGYRYAGKEKKSDGTYKDICVPVKKGK